MEKNWLIRTKSNHILGPISRDKVLELLKNGSIKQDDEVCSGNGFWFYVRESEMVEKYLHHSEAQPFNPISEAKDVLTVPQAEAFQENISDDITMVGGVDLKLLKADPVPAVPDVSEALKIATPAETKKKSREPVLKRAKSVKKPLKKHPYLPYLALLLVVLFLALLYYRKTLVRLLFQGEMLTSVSLMSSAHAQEDLSSGKKKLTERSVTHDKVSFSPLINLDGFRVKSSIEPGGIVCSDLSLDGFNLGVVLYPPDSLNEKFLIKLRECVLKLPDTHPVKRWLKWVSKPKKLKPAEEKMQAFLQDVLNSRYNLITDIKVKNQIIEILVEIPETTLSHKILRSYLYLMIGNVTRSDNILRDVIRKSPYENWKDYHQGESFYQRLVRSHLSAILQKFSQHPSNRYTYELFSRYISEFYNDPVLVEEVQSSQGDSLDGKLRLRTVEKIAPEFLFYLRLSRYEDLRVQKLLKNSKIPLEKAAYWYWYFFNIDPLVGPDYLETLVKVEEKDPLWFAYLLEKEKLSDLFAKTGGKAFLPARRSELKKFLGERELFMMALFKLIELGDLDAQMVNLAVDFVTRD